MELAPTPRCAWGSLIVSCTAQHSHQRIELGDARDAVRQPALRSQLVRWGEGTLGNDSSRGGLLGWLGWGDYCNN